MGWKMYLNVEQSVVLGIGQNAEPVVDEEDARFATEAQRLAAGRQVQHVGRRRRTEKALHKQNTRVRPGPLSGSLRPTQR